MKIQANPHRTQNKSKNMKQIHKYTQQSISDNYYKSTKNSKADRPVNYRNTVDECQWDIIESLHFKNMFAMNPIINDQIIDSSVGFWYPLTNNPIEYKKGSKIRKPKLQQIKKNGLNSKQKQPQVEQRFITQYSKSQSQTSSVPNAVKDPTAKANHKQENNFKLQDKIKLSNTYHFHNLDQLLIEKMLSDNLQTYDCNSIHSSCFKDSRVAKQQQSHQFKADQNFNRKIKCKGIMDIQQQQRQKHFKTQSSIPKSPSKFNDPSKQRKYTPIRLLGQSQQNYNKNNLGVDYSPAKKFVQNSSKSNSPHSRPDKSKFIQTNTNKEKYIDSIQEGRYSHIPISVRQSRRQRQKTILQKQNDLPKYAINNLQKQHSRILVMATSNKYIESLIANKKQKYELNQ